MNTGINKVMLALISASLVLTACSTNTTNENTAAGAVTGAVAGGLLGTLAKGAGSGWVIAGGALVGGLIGGLIGHSMDSSDKMKTYTSLDRNPANAPTSWTNPRTGTVYQIIPTSAPMTIGAYTDCRQYRAIAYHKGKKYYYHGVACRQGDNTWIEMSRARH
ncbi:hypothetical protein AYO45_05670 [Gammaproteobacteria bacterium SCGC AG-212-F23]|nr:hypothetical protein AYO45_05670 [Gammaproteobacteria bacterium SCGC AG-212-F23]